MRAVLVEKTAATEGDKVAAVPAPVIIVATLVVVPEELSCGLAPATALLDLDVSAPVEEMLDISDELRDDDDTLMEDAPGAEALGDDTLMDPVCETGVVALVDPGAGILDVLEEVGREVAGADDDDDDDDDDEEEDDDAGAGADADEVLETDDVLDELITAADDLTVEVEVADVLVSPMTTDSAAIVVELVAVETGLPLGRARLFAADGMM